METDGDSNSVVFNDAATPYFSQRDRAERIRTLLVFLDLHDAEVGISVFSAEDIRILNRDYRGLDVTTDVLSFAMLEVPGEKSSPVETAAKIKEARRHGHVPVLLGDIVLSAAELPVESLGDDRPVFQLVIHGLLHLLGHNHDDDDDYAVMEECARMCEQFLFSKERS